MAKKGPVLNIPKLSKAVIENKPSIDEKAAEEVVKRAPVSIKQRPEKKKVAKGRVKIASFSIPESLLDRLDEYVAQAGGNLDRRRLVHLWLFSVKMVSTA